MIEKPVIGLIGERCSGKTAFCNALQKSEIVGKVVCLDMKTLWHRQGLREDIALIDGLQNSDEVKLLHQFPRGVLIYVTAPIQIRYHRNGLKAREEKRKQEKFSQFVERDKGADQVWIPFHAPVSDKILENSGSRLSVYQDKVHDLFFDIVLP